MADQDRGTDDGPNLELPSLRFGRKKKARAAGTDAPDPSPVEQETPPTEQDSAAAGDDAADAPEAPAHRAADPAGAAADQSSPQQSTTEEPAAAETVHRPPEQETTAEVPADDPGAARAKRRRRGPPRPSRPLLRGRGPGTTQHPPEPSEPAAATATTDPGATKVEDVAEDTEIEDGSADTEPVRHEPLFTLPQVSGRVAALITGLVVGVTLVLLTYASLRLCEVVKGTSSCGGPGLLLMVAVLIGLVFLGRALLGAWQVPDPLSTSMLAVGLLAVIVLLVLVDVIFSWVMAIVIPLVAMATFALSHWVTANVIEPYGD